MSHLSWRNKVWQLLKISTATQQCTHMLRGLDHPSNFSIQGFVGLSTCKNCLTAVQNRKNCKIRCSPGNTDQHFLFLTECTSPHILQEQDHGSHYNSSNFSFYEWSHVKATDDASCCGNYLVTALCTGWQIMHNAPTSLCNESVLSVTKRSQMSPWVTHPCSECA